MEPPNAAIAGTSKSANDYCAPPNRTMDASENRTTLLTTSCMDSQGAGVYQDNAPMSVRDSLETDTLSW